MWPIAVSVAVVGFVIDLCTKIASVLYLDPANPPSYLWGFLKLQLARNPGAAFSLGTSMTIGLSIFAIVAFLGVAFVAIPRVSTRFHALIAGLLLAGIAGNLVDRLFRAPGPLRGHVVDMIQLPYFAIFNVADICITCAAGLIILAAFRAEK